MLKGPLLLKRGSYHFIGYDSDDGDATVSAENCLDKAAGPTTTASSIGFGKLLIFIDGIRSVRYTSIWFC